MSSFRGLGIGISAIFANQRALDVTGHNISNVNTTGYSRQVISNSNSFYEKLGVSGNGRTMQLGYGVDVQQIKQYRDEFLDRKYKKESTELGYWQTRYESVSELERIFSDNSEEGLQVVMNNFWNSWEQLSKPSGGLTARALVKENAIAFVETVHNMDKLLNNFRLSKDTEIRENISRINEIAKRVAELNVQIKKTESHGGTANDLRDERESLIDELSRKVKIQIVSGDSLSIAIEGRRIVDGGSYDELIAVPDAGNNGYVNIAWKSTGERLNVTSGSLKSILDCRDVLAKEFREDLNEFVKAVATEINNLHIRGYGVKDDKQRYFFINDKNGSGSGIDLSNIALNPELNDFDNIAAAESPYNTEDNRIALEISKLRLKDIFSEDRYIADANSTARKQTFDEFYRSIISEIGNIGQEAYTAAEAQLLLVEQIDYRRQALSGVSLDEEMSNLIRFEHSYSAATRIVNAMDEMLEVIINKIGRVGR